MRTTKKEFDQKQLFLDTLNYKKLIKVQKPLLKIINWNISNPSKQKAIKQVKWLQEMDADIILLTETKFSKGCKYIRDRLENLGYYVLLPIPKENKYGVLMASKPKPSISKFLTYIDFLRSRVISINISYLNNIEIIGMYVPNQRNEKKKRFLNNLLTALNSFKKTKNLILCGDFNILEPDHIPTYSKFEEWEYNFYNNLLELGLIDVFRHLNKGVQEYSWIGRTGNGYRYDHFFASSNLVQLIEKCYYLHKVRMLRLSDHSAMYIEINIDNHKFMGD